MFFTNWHQIDFLKDLKYNIVLMDMKTLSILFQNKPHICWCLLKHGQHTERNARCSGSAAMLHPCHPNQPRLCWCSQQFGLYPQGRNETEFQIYITILLSLKSYVLLPYGYMNRVKKHNRILCIFMDCDFTLMFFLSIRILETSQKPLHLTAQPWN